MSGNESASGYGARCALCGETAEAVLKPFSSFLGGRASLYLKKAEAEENPRLPYRSEKNCKDRNT